MERITNVGLAAKCGVGGVFVSLGGTLCHISSHTVGLSSFMLAVAGAWRHRIIGQILMFYSFLAISDCFSAYQARTRCL